jgi:S1-C subfamily serine protease
MIAEPLEQPPADPSIPVSPAPPQGGGRNQTRSALAVGLVLLGSLAGGALGAEAIISRQAPTSTPATTSAARASSASSVIAAKPQTAATIYQQAAPGVVTVSTEVARRNGQVGQGTGSGIVLDQNGDILTNAHVIAGASQIQVTFNDGRTVAATVAGSSTTADLAVVKVSVAASSLHPLVLGNSDTVGVGDTAYAIGAPFDLPESMTAGVISGLNRSNQSTGLTGLIQTDAPINPGNSGGPLLNAQGQVIGVDDSIESPIQGNVGIGFAIPINAVKRLLGTLEGGANQ